MRRTSSGVCFSPACGEFFEALGNRRAVVLVEIDELRHQHGEAMAVAERAAEGLVARHEARDRGGSFVVDRFHPRLVDDREVIQVGGVFELDLPVAVEAEAMFAVRLDRIARALLHEQVDPRLGAAEEIFERLDLLIEAREDQP
jgi:hypothetical protein